jgi:hypothetical protein
MSEALTQALETVGRGLERGLLEAERELDDVRERCRSLETEVRSLRAAVRPMAPEVTALLARAQTAADPPQASVGEPHREPTPPSGADLARSAGMVVVPGDPAAAAPGPEIVPPADAETHPDDDGSAAGYMPMLEELWVIARNDAS